MNHAAIGSPRMMSPRSHRTHRAQYYPTTSQGSQYHENYEYQDNVAENSVPADNLHGDDSAFNVDPGAPILGAGQQTIREAQEAEAYRQELKSDRHFVGGFIGGLKKAFKPSIEWGSGSRRQAAEASPESFLSQPPYETSAHLARDPRDVEYGGADARTAHSYSSTPTSSETMNPTAEFVDDGTTAVDHQMMMPTPVHIVDPVLVEPQPASDYAKMDSPTMSGSEVSLNTYMSRIARFFKEINDLPWVAERVTVDYYPGQSRRRTRPRAAHRPILSWYNRHIFPSGGSAGQAVSLDLTAGSTGSSSPTPMQPQPLYQSFIIAPTASAQPVIPEMQQTAPSTNAAPSIVFTVVNGSAATSSSTTTDSPRVTRSVPQGTVDPERMYAQQLSGYTPVQPTSGAFGTAIHAGYTGAAAAVAPASAPTAPAPVASPPRSTAGGGSVRATSPPQAARTYRPARSGTPAQSSYYYTSYVQPTVQ